MWIHRKASYGHVKPRCGDGSSVGAQCGGWVVRSVYVSQKQPQVVRTSVCSDTFVHVCLRLSLEVLLYVTTHTAQPRSNFGYRVFGFFLSFSAICHMPCQRLWPRWFLSFKVFCLCIGRQSDTKVSCVLTWTPPALAGVCLFSSVGGSPGGFSQTSTKMRANRPWLVFTTAFLNINNKYKKVWLYKQWEITCASSNCMRDCHKKVPITVFSMVSLCLWIIHPVEMNQKALVSILLLWASGVVWRQV